MRKCISMATVFVVSAAAAAHAEITVGSIAELSGVGATAGTNWYNGLTMAFEEINRQGGILGETVNILSYDSQSDPQISRALVQKAIDEDVYVLMGTVYSGSTVVNMLVAQQNGFPQITGSEAPRITQLGNPYIFRTTYGSQKGMPRIASYVKESLKAQKVAVAWVNSEFGKGAYEAFIAEAKKKDLEIVADIPSEAGQVDFGSDISRLKQSGADAIFVYLNEEENARFLREARKQNLQVPLIGDAGLVDAKVIQLAGEAANGALGHVALSASTPIPEMQDMASRFQQRYGELPGHDAIKGYTGAWVIKCVTELVGEADRQKFADKMHGLTLTAAECPGVLLDISWDENGEVSRGSFIAKVVDGKQEIIDTITVD